MLNQIDGAYVAAQIRLLRQVQKGAILLLEGLTDEKIFDRFIDRSTCEIEIAFGKTNLLEALDLLEDEGFGGVVGVIDADFDRLTGSTHTLENICVTEVHDLDLLIFLSPAFDRYIAEYGDEERIERQFRGDLDAIRSAVIECCLPLSCCRLASERRKLRLRFKDLRHDEFVDLDKLQIDRDRLAAAIITASPMPCTIENLMLYMRREQTASHDPHQLANGHDVAAVLGIALRKMIGHRRDVHTWANEVESGLRLAFDWNAMTRTCLYSCLRTWETNNRPYRIFPR